MKLRQKTILLTPGSDLMSKYYVNTTNVLTWEDIVANYISILTMLLRSYDDVTLCVCVCVCACVCVCVGTPGSNGEYVSYCGPQFKSLQASALEKYRAAHNVSTLASNALVWFPQSDFINKGKGILPKQMVTSQFCI